MSARTYWWIKERHNPQLGTYFTCAGPMTIKAAKKHEQSLYGYNIMHRYNTEHECESALKARAVAKSEATP